MPINYTLHNYYYQDKSIACSYLDLNRYTQLRLSIHCCIIQLCSDFFSPSSNFFLLFCSSCHDKFRVFGKQNQGTILWTILWFFWHSVVYNYLIISNRPEQFFFFPKKKEGVITVSNVFIRVLYGIVFQGFHNSLMCWVVTATVLSALCETQTASSWPEFIAMHAFCDLTFLPWTEPSNISPRMESKAQIARTEHLWL